VDNVKPGVSGRFIRKCEDNIDFFEGSEGGLGVKEVDEWNNGEICRSEDDPCTVSDVGERNWSNENNTV
jgi:hypothetical protein